MEALKEVGYSEEVVGEDGAPRTVEVPQMVKALKEVGYLEEWWRWTVRRGGGYRCTPCFLTMRWDRSSRAVWC